MTDGERDDDVLSRTFTDGLGEARPASADAALPCLTLLLHPEPARVGEVAFLAELAAGRSVAVSRTAPDFGPPGRGAGRPLEDRFVSRRPLVLTPANGGAVRIEPGEGPPLTVDRVPARGPVLVTPAALRHGTVLELGGRVVLLLHVRRPRVARGPRDGIVGESDAVTRLREDVARVTDLEVPVLVLGETGVGKELVARAIHAGGRRAGHPLVTVNMAAIPASTAASELFGYRRGAFTGAIADHDGYFRRAHGGTLLLDEIGEAGLELQSILLRVLDTGEIQPIGARAAERVDVRVIAATDRDLAHAVAEGSFRAPLFHRLAGYELPVPPLRERRDDIARLFVHFLRGELAAAGEERLLAPSATRTWLPAAAVARLVLHPFPGNVRELQNVVRHLAVASRGMDALVWEPALDRLLAETAPAVAIAPPEAPPPADGERTKSRGRRPSAIDDDELVATLLRNEWRPCRTAEELGISRTSLYDLMDRCPRIRTARDLGRDELLAAAATHRGDLERMAASLQVSRRALQLRLRELGLAAHMLR